MFTVVFITNIKMKFSKLEIVDRPSAEARLILAMETIAALEKAVSFINII